MRRTKDVQAKILVVDDDQDILEVIEYGLQLPDIKLDIITATNGRTALEKAKGEQPDLIILDLLLPDLDGFAVVKELKKDPSLRDIKIIMLTALDTDTNRYESIDLDVDDFVGKPFDLFDLESRVRYQLLGKREER